MQGQRLTFVTQRIDRADPVLGITADLIRALGRICELTVIANEVTSLPTDLPARIFSLGKESGATRIVRATRYLRTLERLTRPAAPSERCALFVHMCPVYVHVAAPIAKVRHVPMLLWYTQAQGNRSLGIAERLADCVVTTVPGSYPGRKAAIAIGQAIDTEAFPYCQANRSGPLNLLAIGRTSRSKRHDLAIRAVAEALQAGLDVRLRILAPSTTRDEKTIRTQLHRLIEALDLSHAVTLEAGLPRSEIPEALRRCDALVSTTVEGSADKAVFEAMSTGRPVLACNPALEFLGESRPLRLRFDAEDAADLADAIRGLSQAEPADVNAVGRRLRELVVRDHSLEQWAARVVALLPGSE
jgi:glycosyltransferase involved in cell wall biosynthesis